ncbi:MAG: chromosome partitioning protein ParB, partial [Tenericutes bacterium HGW-Tenericutes-6]
EKVGKSRSHVTNTLGLLNLPEEVQNMLLTSQISMGHARALSKLENKAQVIKLAKLVVSKQLSVRQIEELTKIEDKTNKIQRKETSKYLEQETKLSKAIGHKIKIDDKKIVIYYKEDSIDDIIQRLTSHET